MSSKLAGFVLVGASCVAAAGAGAYLANRQNGQLRSDAQIVADAPVAPSPASEAVKESEGQITGAPATRPDPAPAAAADKGTPPRESVETRRAPAFSRDSAKPKTPRPPAPQARSVEADRPEPPRTAVTPTPATAQEPVPVQATRTPEPVSPAPESPVVPERRFEELVVPADSVVGLQVESSLSSHTARVEDRVTARVTRDVRVSGEVAIPAGSKAQGAVVLVERGGKFKERARLGVRFHTIVLADGTTLPLQTETVFREGDAPTGQSAAKIGGAAVGGAILGAILGGGKGALVGGATGAGAGTAAVAAGDRSEATLSSGSRVTVRLSSPVAVTVEKRD